MLEGIDWDISDIGWCDCTFRPQDDTKVVIEWFNNIIFNEDDSFDNYGCEFVVNLNYYNTHAPNYTPFFCNQQVGIEIYRRGEVYIHVWDENDEMEIEITATPINDKGHPFIEICYHNKKDNSTAKKVIQDNLGFFKN